MLRVLSTHLFLNHRLHPGVLELAGRAGAQGWRSSPRASTLTTPAASTSMSWPPGSAPTLCSRFHACPLFPDREMGRAGAPAVNVLHPEKSRRIDAMDEIKRALESAEEIPFKNLVLQPGRTRGRLVAAVD